MIHKGSRTGMKWLPLCIILKTKNMSKLSNLLKTEIHHDGITLLNSKYHASQILAYLVSDNTASHLAFEIYQ